MVIAWKGLESLLGIMYKVHKSPTTTAFWPRLTIDDNN